MPIPPPRPPTAAVEPVRRLVSGRTVVTLLPRGAYEAAYVPEHGVVGFAFETQCGEHAFASDRLHPFRRFPHTFSWVPPGCGVRSFSAAGGEYLTVSTAGDAARPLERFGGRRDVAATRAAHALRARLLGGADDALATAADIETLRDRVARPCTEDARDARVASWLTASRLRRLDECIDACLGERPDVARLAESCGVSASFLSRMMRAALGSSPHRYLVERRLACARERLVQGRESVADVALACGFASHAHLTDTLRRTLGVTPTALRTHRPPRPSARPSARPPR